MEKVGNTRAQIGCGSIILIAIVVMMFSGTTGSKKLLQEIEQLNAKVDRLERKLDELSRTIPPPSTTPAPGARP